MTKVWDGPTPYPDGRFTQPEEVVALLSLRKGFAEAMNSPTVRAMYEWLRLYVNFLDGGGDVPDTLQAMGVLAAYANHLKENDDG